MGYGGGVKSILDRQIGATRNRDASQGELGLAPRVDDRAAAEARRDAGIALSSDNAGPEWRERAIGYVREWVARGNRGPFLCEHVRAFAERDGLPVPRSRTAWGWVMRKAADLGVVYADGYAPANSSNRGPKSQWFAR